eukprot:m.360319 g.360319  ORF g.360319 m.360319 type:complete len:245 (+) comp18972_c0_seq1:132-866(+)
MTMRGNLWQTVRSQISRPSFGMLVRQSIRAPCFGVACNGHRLAAYHRAKCIASRWLVTTTNGQVDPSVVNEWSPKDAIKAKDNVSVVLFEPEIPPNTGTIARQCAAVTTPLHLIKPLGFDLTEKRLLRAGLDYWQHVRVFVWEDWNHFVSTVQPSRCVLVTKKAGEDHLYHHFKYEQGDHLVFGAETRGLPPLLMDDSNYNKVRIPMWGEVRSLNLAASVSIVLYTALQGVGHTGMKGDGSCST